MIYDIKIDRPLIRHGMRNAVRPHQLGLALMAFHITVPGILALIGADMTFGYIREVAKFHYKKQET